MSHGLGRSDVAEKMASLHLAIDSEDNLAARLEGDNRRVIADPRADVVMRTETCGEPCDQGELTETTYEIRRAASTASRSARAAALGS